MPLTSTPPSEARHRRFSLPVTRNSPASRKAIPPEPFRALFPEGSPESESTSNQQRNLLSHKELTVVAGSQTCRTSHPDASGHPLLASVLIAFERSFLVQPCG